MTQSLQIPVTNDASVESMESLFVAFREPNGLVIGTSSVVLTIIDNDGTNTQTPGIIGHNVVVNESDGTATFSLRLTHASTQPVTVSVATENGTAVAGADFAAIAGQTVTFAPGETVRNVTVALTDDTLLEGREHFFLRLSNPANGTVLTPVVTGAIAPSDQPNVSIPILSFGNTVVSEADGFATVEFRLSSPTTSTVTARLVTNSGTASQFADAESRDVTIAFAPGETVHTVRIPITNETSVESYESFYLVLDSVQGATTAISSTLISIVDNDTTSSAQPSLVVEGVTVNETDQTATFTVRLTQPTNNTVTVTAATVAGSATAGNDFVGLEQTLVFGPRETVRTVTVQLVDDATSEGIEDFSLVLSNPVNATIASGQGTAIIGASDTAPSPLPYLYMPDIAVGEADGYATVTLRLSSPTNNLVSLRLRTDSATGSGFGDTDYRDVSVTFAPGETIRTVRVAIGNDTAAEPTESVYLSVFGVSNAIAVQPAALVTIVDNDSLSTQTPGIIIENASVNENDGAAVFTVRLTNQGADPISVTVNTAPGTAIEGQDFQSGSQRLTFAPGETVKTFRVVVTDDTTAEATEQFWAILSNPTGATILDGAATGTIAASDQALSASPTISVGTVAAHESQGIAEIPVTLSSPSSLPVTVRVSYSSGSASTLSDISVFSTTVTFAPGETLRVVGVPIVQDTFAEPAESLTVNLSSATNATIAVTSATLTIQDMLTPLLSVNAPTIIEGGAGTTSNAQLTFTLSTPSTAPVTVQVATSNGTATAGSDYTAVNSIITFQPGQTTATLNVPIQGDTAREGNELINVTLSNVSGAMLSGGLSTLATVIQIQDDDGSPAAAIPVYRFYNTRSGGHFFTASDAERAAVIATEPELRFEGIGFLAGGEAADGLVPVFRFYNTRSAGHFFTASTVERDAIINGLPHFRFEGIGFYADPDGGPGTTPVFRFLNLGAGGHFYTSSVQERDTVLAIYPSLQLEGIGFYSLIG